jgi:hypothetical protein
MKWMGCLNHDLPYSIDNPSEKPRERRATQNWRAPTEKREKKIVGVSETIHHLEIHMISPSSDGRMRIRQHER